MATEFTLEAFANERYELLKLLCDHQVKVKDAFYVTPHNKKLLTWLTSQN